MAFLDVSEVISDPLFTSPVTLIRSAESYDGAGNPVWHEAERVRVMAVVTSDTKALSRLPEALRREGSILVRFLADDAPGFSGRGFDEAEWRGKRFLIKDSGDYSQFGRGFIRLTCSPAEVSDGSY